MGLAQRASRDRRRPKFDERATKRRSAVKPFHESSTANHERPLLAGTFSPGSNLALYDCFWLSVLLPEVIDCGVGDVRGAIVTTCGVCSTCPTMSSDTAVSETGWSAGMSRKISHSAKLAWVERADRSFTVTRLMSLVSATEPRTCTRFPSRTALVITVTGGISSRKLETPPIRFALRGALQRRPLRRSRWRSRSLPEIPC